MPLRASEIINDSGVPGATVADALNYLLLNKLQLSTEAPDVVNSPAAPLSPTSSTIVRLNNAALSGGAPSDGQILMYLDGELQWVDP